MLAARAACYLLVVQKRMLVVVERDAWVHRALADGAAGLELVECSTARAGLNACCALEPMLMRFDLWLKGSVGARTRSECAARAGSVKQAASRSPVQQEIQINSY